jgi:hypothetical protein
MAEVTNQLETEGLATFERSWSELGLTVGDQLRRAPN